MSEHTATRYFRARNATPTRLLRRFGPRSMFLLSEVPWNSDAPSNTTRTFVVVLVALTTPWCGRYQVLSERVSASSLDRYLAWPKLIYSSITAWYFRAYSGSCSKRRSWEKRRRSATFLLSGNRTWLDFHINPTSYRLPTFFMLDSRMWRPLLSFSERTGPDVRWFASIAQKRSSRSWNWWFSVMLIWATDILGSVIPGGIIRPDSIQPKWVRCADGRKLPSGGRRVSRRSWASSISLAMTTVIWFDGTSANFKPSTCFHLWIGNFLRGTLDDIWMSSTA